MKSMRVAVLACALLLALGATVAMADSHTDSPEFLAQTYHVKVLPGHGLDFEKAYTEHVKMHVEAGDATAIHVWEVIAGKNVGSYYIRSSGFTWAEMDEHSEVPNHREQTMEALSPHIKSLSSWISEMMPSFSNWPADSGVPKMADVTMFSLDYELIDDFFYGIGKIHAMIGEHDVPYTYAWYKVVVGGEGAQVYISMPRMTWAEFKEPSPNLWEVAAEVMGKRESEELRARIGAAILSEENFVVIHRDDLSYIPE